MYLRIYMYLQQGPRAVLIIQTSTRAEMLSIEGSGSMCIDPEKKENDILQLPKAENINMGMQLKTKCKSCISGLTSDSSKKFRLSCIHIFISSALGSCIIFSFF